jgi:hypothetical protein
MHREPYRFVTVGDVVVVERALHGTHKEPLPTPMGSFRRRTALGRAVL